MANALAEQLERLAERVRRLSPSHRDPMRFFEEKSEIDGELVRLARDHRRQPIA